MNIKIKDLVGEWKCDYGHRFIGSKVAMVTFRNDGKRKVGGIYYTSKDKEDCLTGGRPEEGYLFACPVCGVIQLDGFTPVEGKQLDTREKEDITRKIDLKL